MQEIKVGKNQKQDYFTAEAFKSLRTNLQFSGSDVRVIAFTSCTPGEGKTTVSFLTARAFAESEKKVLYIDADMRKSAVASRYKISKAKFGLSHFLSGQCTLENVLCVTDIPKLHMILAGPFPPNPAELVEGKYMKALIESAKSIYDYIIIDTPPLGSVIDSAIISKYCDGIAMVISANTISYKFAQKVKEQLEVSGCKLLGVILNKVDNKQNGYYGKYYGAYYGKEE